MPSDVWNLALILCPLERRCRDFKSPGCGRDDLAGWISWATLHTLRLRKGHIRPLLSGDRVWNWPRQVVLHQPGLLWWMKQVLSPAPGTSSYPSRGRPRGWGAHDPTPSTAPTCPAAPVAQRRLNVIHEQTHTFSRGWAHMQPNLRFLFSHMSKCLSLDETWWLRTNDSWLLL